MRFRIVSGAVPELRGKPGVLVGVVVPPERRAAVANLIRSVSPSRSHLFGQLAAGLRAQRPESSFEIYVAVLDPATSFFANQIENLRALLTGQGLTDASEV